LTGKLKKEIKLGPYTPKLVCFSCKFSWGYLSDETGIAAQVKNWIPVICSGKIDAPEIIEAFHNGADGVLILGCPEGDCHYQDGNCEARKKVYLLQKILETQGIKKERLKIILDRDPEGKRIPEFVMQMSRELAAMGQILQPGQHPKTSRENRGGGK
jgi:F420-non-reducing hydrogenase iron-sulfur subunit